MIKINPKPPPALAMMDGAGVGDGVVLGVGDKVIVGVIVGGRGVAVFLGGVLVAVAFGAPVTVGAPVAVEPVGLGFPVTVGVGDPTVGVGVSWA